MKKINALKVLIVDDEEIIRETLNDFFDYLGHTAIAVDNGLEGLKAIETSDYHVAFVDIRMPGIDGIEFLQRLEKINMAKQIPVFIMTGHGDDATRDEAMAAGASGFLCKPFGIPEIQSIMNQIIESMRKEECVKKNDQILNLSETVHAPFTG